MGEAEIDPGVVVGGGGNVSLGRKSRGALGRAVQGDGQVPEKGLSILAALGGHKALGGGVTIDLIHEWDYLVDLFGVPETICNIRGKYSDLEIDSDDLSIYIAQYPTLLAEVHLDYFGRTYRRSIELFCKDGSCVADFGAGTLTLPNGAVEHYEEDVNERYLREMNYFLDYAAGEETESLTPPATALQVLKLTLGEQQ